MNLYNTIKKYTANGKLVVTKPVKSDANYHIYTLSEWAGGKTPKDAYEWLDRLSGFDYKEESVDGEILGFYNPETGKVEPIENVTVYVGGRDLHKPFDFLCNDCGQHLLKLKINQDRRQKSLSTWYNGICDRCHQKTTITQSRDFGYPRAN